MCLILFAYNAHPRYRLILAANRDEFYARPATAANFWEDAPELLAGRDLAAGGTWLGITKLGRFAAVTNFRDPLAPVGIKSRGDLTKHFLTQRSSPKSYLHQIEKYKMDYSGFNLLVGDFRAVKNNLFYLSNRAAKLKRLQAGIYGLSNALLNTAWPKVETGKAKFAEILHNSSGKIKPESLFEILADKNFAPAEKLPNTGVGMDRERVLSPAFIETDGYGTRLSTVLLIEQSGVVHFIEKTFVPALGKSAFKFFI